MNNPVVIFIHYLEQLQKIVAKIEQSCAGDADILQARLHENMLPLINQIRTAANFALRGVCPLIGNEPVSFEKNQNTFHSLDEQIKNTIRYLGDASTINFDYEAIGDLSETAGFAVVKLPAEQFIHLYILPNFYFHFSMVYAIARSRGVPLSKQDFDGLHQYPAGFSFESR